jgi:molybdopterin-biosynthesis enzyme MoeA-like protein
MERVETLLKKLQEQFEQKAPAGQLLLTVQMLQAELYHLQSSFNGDVPAQLVSVTLSQNNNFIPGEEINDSPVEEPVEEKIIEVLQVDESEIEAELEEIKRKAETINKISVHNKPAIVFDPEIEEDIPTLAHQHNYQNKKEINEVVTHAATSINEKLKQSKIDLGESFTDVPIRDLKKAIAVNDRFLFINELFRGDEAVYERSIKTINNFSILPEAEYWIQRELKVKNGWNDKDELVKQFYQLVKRRFS